MIERSRVQIPAGAAGEFYSPGSIFCADSSHASAVSTSLRSIFKNALKKLVTPVESHASAVSLPESGE